MKLRWLVTGTGHCGTGYVARLFTEAGVLCGHEHIFTVQGFEPPGKPPWGIRGDWCAESSWPAAFHMHHPFFEFATIVHLMRHPLHVLHSFRTVPSEYESTILRILAINAMIENYCAREGKPYIRVQAEQRRGILDVLGFKRAEHGFDDNHYNTHRADANYPGWDDLEDTVPKFELQEMAVRYGYQV